MKTSNYQQPIKEQARQAVLQRAVLALTTQRQTAPIVRADEFDETLEYSLRFLEQCDIATPFLRLAVKKLSTGWHAFHKSVIGTKKACDLKVLYLCGPEPQNDLRVLLSLGVIPQNIWGIESNVKEYAAAVEQLKHEDLYIRIHHGNLGAFFDYTNERFDIVYIDACAALPGGRPNTILSTLMMFLRERLAPISALITNFAQPPVEKQNEYERLFCYYFGSRYNDVPSELFNAGADPVVAHGDPLYLQPLVHNCFDQVYSEFITRFIVDLGREIVPFARIYDNPDVRKKYFSSGDEFRKAIERATAAPPVIGDEDSPRAYFSKYYAMTGDVTLNPSGYPLLRFFLDVTADKQVLPLIEALFSHKLKNEFIETALRNSTLLARIVEGHWNIASADMINAVKNTWFDYRGRFYCDVPLPNLIINSLFGIYGHPYLPNPRKSTRFTYTAKETKMYTDLLVLDQCRYYYDYLPTIDLIPSIFQSIPYQLVFRSCLDRMGRHDFSCSSHPFRGAALGGFGEFASAKSYDFMKRKKRPPVLRRSAMG